MKASRLKTIVIFILLLVNVFLLILLLSRRAEQNAAYERTVDQLISLYASNGVTLERGVLSQDDELFSAETQRDASCEAAFAEALLESTTLTESGGVTRYTGACGSCSFRSGGAVEAVLSRPVSDAEDFCDTLFRSFGYTRTGSTLLNGSGSITAVRVSGDTRVFNATLTFSFLSGSLVSVSGTLLSSLSDLRRIEGIDAVSALVRFLDYRTTSGVVCTQVTALDRGYLVQSTPAAQLSLVPVWRVETDVNVYYVNFTTGEITRE